VITFHHLGNQTGNAKTLINIILAVFRGENLVEIVDFSPVKSSLGTVHLFQLGVIVVCVMNNFDLVIAIDLYFASMMSVFKM